MAPNHRSSLDSLEDTNPNVFADDYALPSPTLDDDDEQYGVADGMRSMPPRSASSRPDYRMDWQDGIEHAAPLNTAEAEGAPLVKRNSISKGLGGSGSFAMANEASSRDSMSTIRQSASGDDTISAPEIQYLQRSMSPVSSYATTERAQSPLQEGPSHPYGMYPQTTSLGRTMSAMTTSTVRSPSTTYTGNRPAHPYAMYQQNLFADPDNDSASPSRQAIPVGFPGRTHDYHRQIGPDGEEQDIVGPDGHTEQLPPYSRFPAEAAPKLAAVPVPSAPLQSASVNNSSSRDSLQTPLSSPVNNNSGSMAESSGSKESNVMEKAWNEKTWKEKRKTKLCCGVVPCWLMTIGIILMVVIVSVLGAVVGGVLERESRYEVAPVSSMRSLLTPL
ncbi:hypothetical protein LTS18_012964 [Coniosporium uncinatum]|uniref:Uncharacterized protein n=1 Tax=Coniosporium uncinatum TaxID=93489 RepID=A0ACC3DVU3_9PEZI|nr:hypothetical protein LTS18_012964 [Coniosporium uncinatum]